MVWWAWNYTTWVTNELDPDSPAVRLLLIALMLLTLLMAVAIPDAFGQHGLLFAASYVAIQVGRHAFLTFVVEDRGSAARQGAGHILVWFLAAAPLWIAGGVAEGDTRTTLWVAALAIEYAGPVATYWIPGRPTLKRDAWELETAHFAERFQLFVIIALGETIVLTGATTSELPLTPSRVAAFGLAFLGTAAFWWLYFNFVAGIAERRLSLASDRVALGRDAYTYIHVVMVMGIILAAVGDELVIAHPLDELPNDQIAAVVGGPALYLVGLVLFRLRVAGSLGWRRLVGAVACLAVGLVGLAAPALVMAGLLVAVLVAVNVSELLQALRRRRRGEPSLREQLEASAVR